jgi:hypothetical protein
VVSTTPSTHASKQHSKRCPCAPSTTLVPHSITVANFRLHHKPATDNRAIHDKRERERANEKKNEKMKKKKEREQKKKKEKREREIVMVD